MMDRQRETASVLLMSEKALLNLQKSSSWYHITAINLKSHYRELRTTSVWQSGKQNPVQSSPTMDRGAENKLKVLL